MAGSSTKGTSKSPKRTRQGKAAAAAPEIESEGTSKSPKRTRQAAAPETESEGTSKSPKRTRQGKATTSKTGSGDFNNEDYNIRSPERTELLTKIKGVINNAPVSPALWACCQLADMNRLQDIAKSSPQMIIFTENPLSFIAMQCELLGFQAKSRWHLTVDMLTVNRGSAIPGFGILRIRSSHTTSREPKEAQAEF
jgi:hypothetical protein